VFAANRTTNNVPEGWLVDHGLTNRDFAAEALMDQDADGMAAWEEYAAGTDPTNAASRFSISGVEPFGTNYIVVAFEDDVPGSWFTQRLLQAEGYVLTWASASNRCYTLYGATGAAAAPLIIAGNLPATPPLNTYTDLVETSGQRFYRLGVICVEP